MAQEIHTREYGRRGAWLAALGLVWVLGLSGCSRPADEQALRDALSSMQRAVEARDASAVMDHVADNFVGDRGLDHDGLRRLLVLQFMRNQRVGVTLGPISMRIEGQRAEARFSAVLTGFQEGLLPARADGYQLITGWRVEDGRWMVEQARWE